MTDKPILFSGPMVRAILEGRKTQTRRVLKPQPRSAPIKHDGVWTDCSGFKEGPYGIALRDEVASIKIPHAVGDRLWVRESFAISGIGWGKKPSQAIGGRVHFAADPEHGWQSYWGKWRPSIHMPRWASRITLTVTDVRVQRLQDISHSVAIAEGVQPNGMGATPIDQFRTLWNSINGPDAWDVNPWVAAYTFEPVLQNIDQIEEAA